MPNRQKILDAAMRVFAAAGFRGATTRRIAEEAGVNEVTLFRLFKTKTTLFAEAARCHADRRLVHTLPSVAVDPERELTTWCRSQLAFLNDSRSLIRRGMAELGEHPQMVEHVSAGPCGAHRQLQDYAAHLRSQYLLSIEREDLNAAVTMLMSALFCDAMCREMMPGMFPQPATRGAARYARMFLKTLGFTASLAAIARTPRARNPRAAVSSLSGNAQ